MDSARKRVRKRKLKKVLETEHRVVEVLDEEIVVGGAISPLVPL